MQFRKLNRSLVLLSAIALAAGLGLTEPARGATPATLFPTNVEGKTWLTFPAEGFSQPACGVVYRMKDEVSCGMPLGGIDTGCIDLETSGLLGFCTIFNTHVPRRGPINLPILGLSVGGKTWVLCDKQPKKAWREKGVPYGKPVIPVLSELKLEGVRNGQANPLLGPLPGGRHGVRDRRPGASRPPRLVALPARRSQGLDDARRRVRGPSAKPRQDAANRHDRVFLPGPRSEGGGNETILFAAVG